MSIVLNLVLLILFGVWFHKTINNRESKKILPVILLFILSTFILFVILSIIENEYLGFIEKFVAGTISLILFWLFTTIEIIVVNFKRSTQAKIIIDLLQTVLLLLIPLGFYWWILSYASLKIGG